MSRTVATRQQELDFLAALIGAEPEGMGLDAISQKLGGTHQRRTLQRRLALLVAQERIKMMGDRRGARYRANPAQSRSTNQPARAEALAQAPTSVYVPTSVEGAEVRAYVTQPRQLRTPVAYQLDFLEQYHPNHTCYLPPNLREQLHGLGQSAAHRHPAGTFARDMLNRLLIDLSWASSHLEGNTYSRLDTERLIEYGQVAEGKEAFETQMILNHKQAIEYLVLNPAHARVDTDTLIALHAFLSDGLMADPTAVGRIRRRAVEIGGSVYLPVVLPQRLEALFGIVVQMASDIADPFEQAFFLMVHVPYLQPFEDVNKRVSRLAANIPFIRHNLCPLSFIDVPQQAYVDAMLGVYELNRVDLLRDVFVWAYERSCQQYVAVKQNLVPPDMFRLRHRQALAEVIVAIIMQDGPATEQTIMHNMPASVAQAEHSHFVQLVLAEFAALHAGNAVRFGIRPLQLAAWQSQHLRGG
ncbi:MAG: Fic family protein [Hydrogenophaga sp.]|uniref:Fic family protein n=1 Tax=Hydrogenophaga sp. TaxID=1904254 RepID=UPI0027187781|nr:Fic family protein [Hydrogenophaga sp.]MDO9570156.1 Fic family protein [Hydrogenophaga sp.]